jgi:hypothetical protein
MINCVPFKFKHFELIKDMLESQKCEWINAVSFKTLPKTGYIALQNNEPIAAGFLRLVEGGYGQLDTFVSNPYLGSKIRHEAIEMVTDNLLAAAKEAELLGIIAVSKDQSIIDRALQKGFKIIPQTLLGILAN